jgi:enamine deaminase RidA (YjgF/YER057c/UK114 family)
VGKVFERAAQSGQGWQGPAGIGDLTRICNAQICRCSDALSVLRGLARHSGARETREPGMTPMANRRTLLMRILQPAEWSKPRGFSHGVAVDGPGRWIVLAGQTGGDEKGEYQSDMAGQVGTALRRIIKLLAEAGAGPEHIVRLTWYLTSRRYLKFC